MLDLALQELLAECQGDSAIQQRGREMLPRFCDPQYKGGFPAQKKAKHDAVEDLILFLYDEQKVRDLEAVAEHLELVRRDSIRRRKAQVWRRGA